MSRSGLEVMNDVREMINNKKQQQLLQHNHRTKITRVADRVTDVLYANRVACLRVALFDMERGYRNHVNIGFVAPYEIRRI